MSATLFLCHRIPFPPNKGDKIRSYHVLKKLSQQGDVYLGTLIDDPMDWNHVNALNAYVKDSLIVERRRLKRHWPLCILGLLKKQALSNILFFSPELKLWVDSLIRNKQVHRIYIFSSTMAQYVIDLDTQIPMVTDFVDVDSLKWLQYARTRWFPINLLYKLEAKRLNAFEKKVASLSKASIFVSNQEVAIFRKQFTDTSKQVVSMQNGVDTNFFNPNLNFANPYPTEEKIILFTGLMDYWPNIDAVTWFVKEVFKPLTYLNPECTFYICGANPTKAVFKLCNSRIKVTGRVPDMRPYLQHADLVVAPLRIARGIQNKVLEAMSMNKLILASPQALEGIDVPQNKAIWELRDPKEWIQTIHQLLQSPAKRAQTYPWIMQHYSWDANLKKIDTLMAPEKQHGYECV